MSTGKNLCKLPLTKSRSARRLPPGSVFIVRLLAVAGRWAVKCEKSRNPSIYKYAAMAELVDATDLKSVDW